MEDFVQKQCKSIEEDLKAFKRVGKSCKLSTKKPGKPGGYAHLTTRKLNPEDGQVKKSSITVSRAALLVKLIKEGEVSTLEIDRELECSHLCHNKLCINTDHLVLESKSLNISRNICSRRRQCQGGHEPACKADLRSAFWHFFP